MKMSKVKITVHKRVDPEHMFDGNVPIKPNGDKWTICTAFKEGQEFIMNTDWKRPDGFCTWAWRDLFKDLSILCMGGNIPWADEGTVYTCCSDGVRPVSFKLERIED